MLLFFRYEDCIHADQFALFSLWTAQVNDQASVARVCAAGSGRDFFKRSVSDSSGRR